MKDGLEEFLKKIEQKPTNETLIDRFVTLVLEEDILDRIFYLKKLVGLLLNSNPYAALKAAALELQESRKEKMSPEYELGALKDVESCFLKLDKQENAMFIREEITKMTELVTKSKTIPPRREVPIPQPEIRPAKAPRAPQTVAKPPEARPAKLPLRVPKLKEQVPQAERLSFASTDDLEDNAKDIESPPTRTTKGMPPQALEFRESSFADSGSDESNNMAPAAMGRTAIKEEKSFGFEDFHYDRSSYESANEDYDAASSAEYSDSSELYNHIASDDEEEPKESPPGNYEADEFLDAFAEDSLSSLEFSASEDTKILPDDGLVEAKLEEVAGEAKSPAEVAAEVEDFDSADLFAKTSYQLADNSGVASHSEVAKFEQNQGEVNSEPQLGGAGTLQALAFERNSLEEKTSGSGRVYDERDFNAELEPEENPFDSEQQQEEMAFNTARGREEKTFGSEQQHKDTSLDSERQHKDKSLSSEQSRQETSEDIGLILAPGRKEKNRGAASDAARPKPEEEIQALDLSSDFEMKPRRSVTDRPVPERMKARKNAPPQLDINRKSGIAAKDMSSRKAPDDALVSPANAVAKSRDIVDELPDTRDVATSRPVVEQKIVEVTESPVSQTPLSPSENGFAWSGAAEISISSGSVPTSSGFKATVPVRSENVFHLAALAEEGVLSSWRWDLLQERLQLLSGLPGEQKQGLSFVRNLTGAGSNTEDVKRGLGIVLNFLRERLQAATQQRLCAWLFEELEPERLQQLWTELSMEEEGAQIFHSYLLDLMADHQYRRALNIVHAVVSPEMDMGWYRHSYTVLNEIWDQLGLSAWSWMEEEGGEVFVQRLKRREDLLPASIVA